MTDVCLLVLFLSPSSPYTLVDLYYNGSSANNGLLQNTIVGIVGSTGIKKKNLLHFFLALIYMLLNNLSEHHGYSSTGTDQGVHRVFVQLVITLPLNQTSISYYIYTVFQFAVSKSRSRKAAGYLAF